MTPGCFTGSRCCVLRSTKGGSLEALFFCKRSDQITKTTVKPCVSGFRGCVHEGARNIAASISGYAQVLVFFTWFIVVTNLMKHDPFFHWFNAAVVFSSM